MIGAGLVAMLLAGAAPFDDKFRQLEGEDWPAPNDYRNAAGAPGFRYWQQKVDYDITARLDEETKDVSGRAVIRYHNHSPDALPYLWLLLDQNIYKRGSASALTRTVSGDGKRRSSEVASWEGGFTIRSVRDASGQPLKFNIVDSLMRVDLPRAVQPNGGEVRFSIEWSFPMVDSKRISGSGGYECFTEAGEDGNCIFQAGQWFPRLAVYSDYEGWHNKTFLAAGGGEFTLEFGDYRVALTLPADHIVAATGELMNAPQVLTAQQRSRLTQAKSAADPVYIVTPDEAMTSERQRVKAEKTWIFSATRVRDFAWASSRKFIWDAMGVDGTLAMSFFAKEDREYWAANSTRAIAHALRVSAGFTFAYPYPVAQSVDGPLGGIEYPMLSFNSLRPLKDQKTVNALVSVVFHEVAHNWFPMIVNTDERQWTWMDEGIVAFLQYQAEKQWDPKFPSGRGEPKDIVTYMLSSNQVPVMTQADSLLQASLNAYAKPATAYVILRETILGRDVFDRALREFAERWRFKRPTPADFFRTIEESSGVDLDWFWRGWFYTTDHVDIALDRLVRSESGYRFDFRNIGGLVMPLILKLDYAVETHETVRIPAEIWRKSSQNITWEWSTAKTLMRAELDPLQETADADRGNNVWNATP